ncbi:hypothetical protein [Psychromonas sp. MME2]|uniref:hypothetical protein n=1 Tax=Psychromonas sp. MME2 TaxID=3231033 RepID=UPI00339C6A4F
MNNITSSHVPSRWKRFKDSDLIYYFLRDKVAMLSFALFLAFFLAALFAPLIAPTNPYDLNAIDLMDSELPHLG